MIRYRGYKMSDFVNAIQLILDFGFFILDCIIALGANKLILDFGFWILDCILA